MNTSGQKKEKGENKGMEGFSKKYFHTIESRTEDPGQPKVCPFCGSKDIHLQQYLKVFYYRCDHCGASVEKSSQDTQQKALIGWNLRLGGDNYIG